MTPRCYLEQFLPLASRAEVGNPILDAEKPNSVIKKPLNKIFQGSSKAFSEWVQVDWLHCGYLIMSLKKYQQLNHYVLGVGSKDILEDVKGRGRKELKTCKAEG